MRKVFLILLVIAVVQSCRKEIILNEDPPPNPYDQIDYGQDTGQTAPAPDPNSIVGLHKNIFSLKCANPGCHDGSFEPDFRTVMSAYNTLVYHKVIKNTTDTAFEYRVVPYDTDVSWLHERLTTGNAVLGRMPLYADPLTDEELGQVKAWILGGAKDMFGQPAVKPNTRAAVTGYLAADSAFNRIDTIRVGGVFYNPFIAPPNATIQVIFLLEDDVTPIEQLQVNRMKLSSSKNDFTSASTFQATYLFAPPNYKLWIVTLDTGLFPSGTTWYFRYYVNDGNHSLDTEFPESAHADAYKTYFSFYVP